MYSKAEVSQLKQEFWTTFGKYKSPVLNSESEKINWVNYKTGFRSVFFRMEADQYQAIIAIEIHHPDKDQQQEYLDRFRQLKAVLDAELNEEWVWEHYKPDSFGKPISRIYTRLDFVNVLNKEHWPQIISFFKPRIIALDSFWNNAKTLFEDLR